MIISSKGTSCCPASTTSPGISFFIMQCQIYLKFWRGTDHALSIGGTPILTLIRPLSPLSSVYSLSFPAPFRLRRRGLCVPPIAPHMQTLTTDRKKHGTSLLEGVVFIDSPRAQESKHEKIQKLR